ncbi:hypothetical protein ACS0TY_018223 [Phlomoides rotata]
MSRFHSLTFVFFLFLISAISEEDGANNYGDGSIVPPPACNNCTICQYPCHSQPPPPYDPAATPPPPPNCPPAAPVVCCGGTGTGQYYAPPSPFYYPYNNYSGAAATLQLSALMGPSFYVIPLWPLLWIRY